MVKDLHVIGKNEADQILIEMTERDSEQEDGRKVLVVDSPRLDLDEAADGSEESLARRPENDRIPRRNYVAIGILFFVNLLNYMDRFTIAGVLGDVQKFFDIGDANAGLLQTIFICTYMIFAPVCGYLGDRYNRKWIMGLGILIWSGTVLASTFVPEHHFWGFLICRGVVGIGEASYSTIAPTLIADLFTKDARSRMLMVFYFAIPVGSGLGFVIGSNVATLMGDWRWGVRVTPILGVVCLALILMVLEEPDRGEAETSHLQPSSWAEDLKHLVKNRSFLWSTMGFTCVAFVAGALSWWTSKFVLQSEKMRGETVDDAHKARVNLIFGIITCLSGFVGVSIGAVWSQIWRRSNPRADPLVCGIGLLVCVPFLFASLNLVNISLQGTWPLIFLAVTSLSLNWSVVSDILMYIVTPPRRATASAFQILISHLLGDAASPYLIGAVSDALRGNDTSDYVHFYGLKHAMFIPTFVLVLGGFFFLATAWFVEGDRRRAELLIKGLTTDADGVAVTRTSAHIEIPSSDSTARLMNCENGNENIA